ncbi:MAG: cell division ATP-binding protein FtsE [Candidatus Margulisiibacteriota bacterium]|jgi:cell division transport system ATP-binding protein
MITLKHVHKIFPNGTRALNNINLHISREEFVFLVGPTAAGKSTLMKLLYRADEPTEGEISIDRINVTTLPDEQIPFLRRNIGVVFQDFKLLPRRTTYENVAFALRVTGTSLLKIRRRVMQVLDLVGLANKAKSLPHELSGGEQQRACIARAIVNNPPILLADEPTGNLDPETSWEIMQLLAKINLHRTTVLVSTHAKEIVDGMRKRVVALENGQILRDQQLGVYTHEDQ